MHIGQRIKQIRTEKNLSQEDLARDLAISRQAVSKWENGSALPDIENLMYISDMYGLSLDTLIKGDHDIENKIVADSAAKKWHWLSIVFFVALVIYIVYLGAAHKVYLIGLGIAALWMLGIELWIVMRKSTKRRTVRT